MAKKRGPIILAVDCLGRSGMNNDGGVRKKGVVQIMKKKKDESEGAAGSGGGRQRPKDWYRFSEMKNNQEKKYRLTCAVFRPAQLCPTGNEYCARLAPCDPTRRERWDCTCTDRRTDRTSP